MFRALSSPKINVLLWAVLFCLGASVSLAQEGDATRFTGNYISNDHFLDRLAITVYPEGQVQIRGRIHLSPCIEQGLSTAGIIDATRIDKGYLVSCSHWLSNKTTTEWRKGSSAISFEKGTLSITDRYYSKPWYKISHRSYKLYKEETIAFKSLPNGDLELTSSELIRFGHTSIIFRRISDH